jgi:hypothetical protein
MSSVATRERGPGADVPESGPAEPPAQRLFEPQGPRLEDAILATWDELVDRGRTACPVCGGTMARTNGCEACGSELL